MKIDFFLNGIHYKIVTKLNKITVHNLLTYFKYNKKIFVVEYNSRVCHRNLWSKQKIRNNDKIEIVSIVGGG